MINKDKTITVAELLAILADGRISPDMPIAVYRSHPDCLVGHVATEILTLADGSKLLTFYTGEPVASLSNIESAAEVFP